MSSDSSQIPKLPDLPNEQSQVEEVFHLYSVLATEFPFDAQSGLGGNLLYAGQIGDQIGNQAGGHSDGRTLLYAANIAGAASIGASADPVVLRQAMRDGIVDFLVNSLEEALRILKNEIRKRQTVSVAVSAEPYLLVDQMLGRGVLPDLLPPSSADAVASPNRLQAEKFLAQGSRQITHPKDGTNSIPGRFVSWSLAPTLSPTPAIQNIARWLPRLDACALAVLPADDVHRRRWLRLAPRYLGRLAQRHHGVVLTADEKLRFEAEIGQLGARHKDESDETVTVTISDGAS
jgi:urocanase-like protein